MPNAKISGIASYVPDDILDNEMLSKMVDTNDEWITTRVGIKQRRILKDETLARAIWESSGSTSWLRKPARIRIVWIFVILALHRIRTTDSRRQPR